MSTILLRVITAGWVVALVDLVFPACEPPSQPLSCRRRLQLQCRLSYPQFGSTLQRSGVNRLDTDIKLVGKFQVPSPPLPWFSGSMVGWPHSVLDSFLAAVSRLWIPPSPFSLNSSMVRIPVAFSRLTFWVPKQGSSFTFRWIFRGLLCWMWICFVDVKWTYPED
ncbi:hypothetical protein C8Q75DRAFT_404050 [Abortiporus biennis]|nr:hypothetical protein C8Q75DRAFT_404050 [Abortiporus biennis]